MGVQFEGHEGIRILNLGDRWGEAEWEEGGQLRSLVRGQEEQPLEGNNFHFPYAEGVEVHCMCGGLMNYEPNQPNADGFGKPIL